MCYLFHTLDAWWYDFAIVQTEDKWISPSIWECENVVTMRAWQSCCYAFNEISLFVYFIIIARSVSFWKVELSYQNQFGGFSAKKIIITKRYAFDRNMKIMPNDCHTDCHSFESITTDRHWSNSFDRPFQLGGPLFHVRIRAYRFTLFYGWNSNFETQKQIIWIIHRMANDLLWECVNGVKS